MLRTPPGPPDAAAGLKPVADVVGSPPRSSPPPPGSGEAAYRAAIDVLADLDKLEGASSAERAAQSGSDQGDSTITEIISMFFNHVLPRKSFFVETARRWLFDPASDVSLSTAPEAGLLHSSGSLSAREATEAKAALEARKLEAALLQDESADMPTFRDSDPPALKRAKAVKWLHTAAYKLGNADATMVLGDMFLYRKFGHRRNATEAFRHYMALASLGNSTAQFVVAEMYASGVGVPRDYPKAMIYASFAALGGNILADQMLAFWHSAGVAMAPSCEISTFHYHRVASQVIEMYRAGPPGGLPIPPPYRYLPDDNGGVYGSGASGASTLGKGKSAAMLSEEELLMLYRLQAETGDVASQFMVGDIYYRGTAKTPRNYAKAYKYFRLAASHYPSAEELNDEDVAESTLQAARYAARATGYLGLMHWRGDGVQADPVVARRFFEQGMERNNGASYNAIGLMHRLGAAGFPKDEAKAIKYYSEAASRDNFDGMVNLAEHLLKSPTPDFSRIAQLLNTAGTNNHLVAYYHLGTLMMLGKGVTKNCKASLYYLKSLSERGGWHDPTIHLAEEALKRGDTESAFMHYLFAAERGYEIAQSNAAWMLDRQIYRPVSWSPLLYSSSGQVDPYEAAIPLWNRAANQDNEDARVKLGDYHYYGLGLARDPPSAGDAAAPEPDDDADGSPSDDASSKATPELRAPSIVERILGISFISNAARSYPPAYDRAAAYYLVAANTKHSSMAMFNLGYMYEHGLGVAKDFHLAKRWYDQALATNPAAYLAVNLALTNLMIKRVLETLLAPFGFGGDDAWRRDKEAGPEEVAVGVPPAGEPAGERKVEPHMPDAQPASGEPNDLSEFDESLVSDHWPALMLFMAAVVLMFWRARVEHQHRAELAARARAAQEAARRTAEQARADHDGRADGDQPDTHVNHGASTQTLSEPRPRGDDAADAAAATGAFSELRERRPFSAAAADADAIGAGSSAAATAATAAESREARAAAFEARMARQRSSDQGRGDDEEQDAH
ncbi:ERAD-associated protein [Polyrhizophydium stewartii]|uniref:ERAD-associated protein n=1 Tax=Polyrhizophydium stewartii TaxID=2732419 RepID=A0ABR4N028_9FUNG